MDFLKVFSVFAVLLILISMYQITNYVSCKNYIRCVQHTASGRVIILTLIIALAMVNKYLAALVIIFLSIFLFDLKEKNGVFDLYNCKVMDNCVKIDNGITSRLEEKIDLKRQHDNVQPRDGDILSTPASVIVNNSEDDVPILDIKSVGNVKFEYS
jgi:hypothetical protein